METEIITVIGLAAGSLTTISFVPQLVRTYKSKKASDISFTMYLVIIAGMATWITYGFLIRSIPIMVANFIAALLCISILTLKVTYETRASDLPNQVEIK